MLENFDHIYQILGIIISNTNDSVTTCCNALNQVAHLYSTRYGRSSQKYRDVDLERKLMCSNCWCVNIDSVTAQCGHLACKNCLLIDNNSHCQICLYKYSTIDKSVKPNFYINSIITAVLSYFEKFLDKKNVANENLRQKNYFTAISDYTTLLNEGFGRHIILSNRCYAYLMIDKLSLAREDSEELLKYTWTWYKAHYRHAMIFKRENNVCGLVASLLNALIFKPDDCLLLSELREALVILLKTQIKGHFSAEFRPMSVKHENFVEVLVDIIHSKNVAYLEKLNIHCSNNGSGIIRRSKSFDSKDSNISDSDNIRIAEDIRTLFKITDFDCPLCMKICLNPVAIICGHTFCRHCIQRSIDHVPTCPLCKADIQIYFKTKDIEISPQLSDIFDILWPLEVAHHRKYYEQELYALTRSPDYSAVMICTVAAPGMPCDLHLFEPRYRLMLRRAIESEAMQFGMVYHDPNSANNHCEIGVMLEIKKIENLTEGRYYVSTCASTRRFRIIESRLVDGYVMARIESHVDHNLDESKIKYFDSLSLSIYNLAKKWIQKQNSSTKSRITKYFGDMPYYKPYSILSQEDLISKLSGKCTAVVKWENQVSQKKRKLNEICANFEAEPSHWIWWLCSVLPVDDKIKYLFLSCRDPIFRIEQLKKVVNSLLPQMTRSDLY